MKFFYYLIFIKTKIILYIISIYMILIFKNKMKLNKILKK